MQTGWLQDQNKWYLLNDDGIMYENVWLLIEGKWYFLVSGFCTTASGTILMQMEPC